MYYYDRIFSTEKEKYDFVNECDREFFSKIESAADDIADDRNIRFILLAGPTCSGKTSATNVLTKTLIKDGKEVVSVSIDDFFKDSAHLKNSDGKVDFESINAIDYELFCKCTESLKKGNATNIPIFDFVKGMRGGERVLDPDDNTIIIFEGIQAVYPEITSLFHEESKKVFISVNTDITAYGQSFSKRRLRFSRRLVRDFLFRGASPELTFKLWDGVVENEDVNIMPYADDADIKLNSFVPYEVNVLAPFVKKILGDMPKNSKYSHLAENILQRYKNIPEISHEYVPTGSFFREFIGEEK